jgi:hypothetical protein
MVYGTPVEGVIIFLWDTGRGGNLWDSYACGKPVGGVIIFLQNTGTGVMLVTTNRDMPLVAGT